MSRVRRRQGRKNRELYEVSWHMPGGQVRLFRTWAVSPQQAVNNIQGRVFPRFNRPPAADFTAERVRPAEPPVPADDELFRRYLY
jgi:hypothetical protein